MAKKKQEQAQQAQTSGNRSLNLYLPQLHGGAPQAETVNPDLYLPQLHEQKKRGETAGRRGRKKANSSRVPLVPVRDERVPAGDIYLPQLHEGDPVIAYRRANDLYLPQMHAPQYGPFQDAGPTETTIPTQDEMLSVYSQIARAVDPFGMLGATAQAAIAARDGMGPVARAGAKTTQPVAVVQAQPSSVTAQPQPSSRSQSDMLSAYSQALRGAAGVIGQAASPWMSNQPVAASQNAIEPDPTLDSKGRKLPDYIINAPPGVRPYMLRQYEREQGFKDVQDAMIAERVSRMPIETVATHGSPQTIAAGRGSGQLYSARTESPSSDPQRDLYAQANLPATEKQAPVTTSGSIPYDVPRGGAVMIMQDDSPETRTKIERAAQQASLMDSVVQALGGNSSGAAAHLLNTQMTLGASKASAGAERAAMQRDQVNAQRADNEQQVRSALLSSAAPVWERPDAAVLADIQAGQAAMAPPQQANTNQAAPTPGYFDLLRGVRDRQSIATDRSLSRAEREQALNAQRQARMSLSGGETPGPRQPISPLAMTPAFNAQYGNPMTYDVPPPPREAVTAALQRNPALAPQIAQQAIRGANATGNPYVISSVAGAVAPYQPDLMVEQNRGHVRAPKVYADTSAMMGMDEQQQAMYRANIDATNAQSRQQARATETNARTQRAMASEQVAARREQTQAELTIAAMNAQSQQYRAQAKDAESAGDAEAAKVLKAQAEASDAAASAIKKQAEVEEMADKQDAAAAERLYPLPAELKDRATPEERAQYEQARKHQLAQQQRYMERQKQQRRAATGILPDVAAQSSVMRF